MLSGLDGPRIRSASPATIAAHVDLVGALYVVWGGLTALLGISMLLLGLGAAALVASENDREGRLAAGLAAGAFLAVAAVAILWGAAHVAIGLPIRRHRPRARLAALMLGVVDLLLFPFGTALGVYALWALLGERGRRLFEQSV